MQNRQHEIDNFLVIEFIEHNKLDKELSFSLLNWYTSLAYNDNDLTREYAKNFLKAIAKKSLVELLYPDEQIVKLVNIFEPLEEILRLAISMKSESRVRDHLSHSIRNLLFSNHIFRQFKFSNIEKRINLLHISAIFHDIAYPLEKMKDVAESLEKGTFIDLLNSKGIIKIELIQPQNIIDLLHYYGEIKNIIINEIIINENTSTEKYQKWKLSEKKWKLLYTEVIAPAIAREGLFEEKHYLTSVILFLRPIILCWKANPEYWKSKIDDICDVCLSMAFHDRNMSLSIFKDNGIKIPKPLLALKIADEFQEWDRDDPQYSHVEDVYFNEENEGSYFLSLIINVRNKIKGENRDFDSIFFVSDKIKGIVEICENQKINLIIKHSQNKLFKNQHATDLINKCDVEINENNNLPNDTLELIYYQKKVSMNVNSELL